MRSEPAPAEERLWKRLRDRQLNGLKFRRQYPVLNYIADFYCAECRLIIELDGDSHSEREEYDAQRTKELQQAGFAVIRFSNVDVFEHFDNVMEEILRVAGLSAPHPSPLPRVRGRGGKTR
jgi:very-short-patch-repair endonuclease